MRDICDYLGGRADKNFLGTGNAGLVIQEKGVRLLFVQRWQKGELLDWASGTVRSWAPDRVEMNEPVSPSGARISLPPSARWIFAARNDILGMTLEWKNETTHDLVIHASFIGILPGEVRMGHEQEAGFAYSIAPYSDTIPQPISFALGSSLAPQRLNFHGENYEVSFEISIAPGMSRQLTLFLGIGINQQGIEKSLSIWKNTPDALESIRQDWNSWFDQEIPRFQSSNPYFEKLYYYRWWSLYTKMIFAQVGHLLYPAPREGVVAFESCVSYSGACISIDELRWMRNPDWVFLRSKSSLPRKISMTATCLIISGIGVSMETIATRMPWVVLCHIKTML